MKRNIFILIVLLVVIGLVSWFVLKREKPQPTTNTETESGPSDTWSNNTGNVTVPNVGETAPANVAVPDVVGPAGNNTASSFREFDINIDRNAYKPDTVIVKKGDSVHINFKSIDKDYQFVQPDYGFKVLLPKGKSTVVEFQASAAGKFKFYCETCGGPDNGPIGYITVVN